MSDSDADEYVYLGTPLQGSDQVGLPVNQQTVRDAAGRQRLHGAFTGGYSAGFYNTVGSQEGFNPSNFTSSRGKRADQRQQNVSDFLDEDELEELREKGLTSKAEYDTFATDSTAKSHTQAADQAAARHGLNLFPDEALRPVVSSIGVQLLQKMGWKQGRGLGFQESNNLEQMGFDLSAAEQQAEPTKRSKRRRWGPMTGLQIQNSAITQLSNKKNTYGLGFDPYANSEEFRIAKKRLREETAQTQRHAVDSKGQRVRGTAFGASVLEDSDVYGGELADYADDADPHAGMHFEVVSSDEDDGVAGGRRRDSPKRVEGSAATALLKARQGTMGRDSFIEGYVRGAMQQPAVVESTRVPARCQPAAHRFEQQCSQLYGLLRQQSAVPAAAAGGPPAPPPADRETKQRIDLAAASVARGGNEMLQFLQKTHAGSKEHSFLDGGDGSTYFQYRTQQISDACTRATTAVLRATVPQLQQGAASAVQRSQGQTEERKLTVDQRRNMLAEPSLSGSTAPATHQLRTQPQADASTATDARAELLAQAEMAGVVRKGAAYSSRFVKAGQGPAEDDSKPAPPSLGGPSSGMLPPTRTQSEWIPSPLLCRAWNVPRPKPSEAPTQAGGATGKELLAVPAAQRGDVYAGALPNFMKPPASSSGREAQLPLPPPPPRGSNTAGGTATAQSTKQHLDQAAEDLLASIQADMVEEVQKAAPEPDELPFEKPLDVFNAIFNETDSEGEDDNEEEGGEVQPPAYPSTSKGQRAEQNPSSSQRPPEGGVAAAHIDAAAQLQQAQKVAVSSAIATLDGGGCGGPSTSGGNGRELRGDVPEAGQDSPGSSDTERERSACQDRKRSKTHKDKDDKRHKKKHKHEHKQERDGRSDRKLLDNATALLSNEVLAQNVSTAEIMAVAAQLNKKNKKHRDKKHKHGSSKHHKRRREHSP